MVTLIIALIGCVGTILQWILYFLHHHVRITFEIYGYRISKYGLAIYGAITNCSDVNLSIGDISLTINDKKFHAEHIPTLISTHNETHGGEVTYTERIMSFPLPMNLYPYSGYSGYFWFPCPDHNLSVPDKDLSFEICTNHGQRISITYPLHKFRSLRTIR